MSESGPDFVKWSEKFISQERGHRVVHYYLEDSSGDSYLAVVGTERSLRHMLYVIADEFCQMYEDDKLQLSSLKWRSRREVVDWLASFLPAEVCRPHNSSINLTLYLITVSYADVCTDFPPKLGCPSA